jgi:hypothetical protein
MFNFSAIASWFHFLFFSSPNIFWINLKSRKRKTAASAPTPTTSAASEVAAAAAADDSPTVDVRAWLAAKGLTRFADRLLDGGFATIEALGNIKSEVCGKRLPSQQKE